MRKTSPNEVLVVALDLLADLDRPAGREAALLASSAKLGSLQPRNAHALRLCAAAALAAAVATKLKDPATLLVPEVRSALEGLNPAWRSQMTILG